MTDLADAALAYARAGIAVFPLKPRAKAPMVANGLHEATTDLEQVRRWWRRAPNANVGIATGARSWIDEKTGAVRAGAGFWVLDVDGEAAEAALAALEAQHGTLPVTVQQQTGRGRHVCFRWDPAGPEMRNRAKVGGADIDVRGNGGYIVAPPSIHPGDEKKGVPPGRRYAWCWGRSPQDLAFADAPGWLVELCRPRDQVAAARVAAEPPSVAFGATSPLGGGSGGTRYGQAVLEGCVRTIVAAQKGTRDSTLYRFACKAAGLVPTGHLELGYLRETLLGAGRAHVPDAMSEAQLVRQVERAIAWGAEHAWGPDPDQRKRRSAVRRADAASPVQQAIARADGLEALARSAPARSTRAFEQWTKLIGVEGEGVPDAGRRIRVTRQDGRLVMALALRRDRAAPPDGAAIFALEGGGACLGWKGAGEGRVAVLAWPQDADQLLVTTHLGDALALGGAAFAGGDPMAVVVAPRLSAFAGAPLGDRWGRVRLDLPQPDPARPAWTVPGMGAVYLAVRRDMGGPELKVRRAVGGTRRVRLEGEAAARFWGGLSAAAWRAAGAGHVRVMTPPGSAVGFCGGGI